MIRRLCAVFFVLLAVSPAATALVAVAQDDGPSTGPFDHSDLVQNGVHDSDAPDSVRMVGDPVRGSVAVRHVPASPFQSEWKFVSPGQTVKTDRLQLYSTAFGEAAGEYQLVVVQWKTETRRVETENGTEKQTVAADQTVQRINVDLDEGYAAQEVKLASAYNETREVTAWLERDGERVDGARWRFQHTSVAAGQSVAIDTKADAWWYAARNAILPGFAGIIIGLSLARATLRKTGRGPGYGLGMWGFIGAIGVAAAVGGAYYEVAAILANFDMLMGLSLGLAAYGGGLRMHAPLEYVGFERKELRDAKALRRGEPGADGPDAGDPLADGGHADSQDVIEIPEDDYKDEMYEDLPELPTVRSDDGKRHIPVTGIKPFFARLFADAARLDLSSLRTRVRVASGRLSEKIYVSPESEEAVEHKPARLKRRMPVWHRLPKNEDGEDPDLGTCALYGALTVLTLGLPYIGWHFGEQAMQTPIAGAAVGLVLLAIESYGAHDGEIDFEPAPRHFLSADASLTILQDEHADAKTLEEFEEIAWEERSRTALEAREIEARRDESITQKLNEGALGMDLGVLGGESATEDEREAAEELLGSTDDPEGAEEARADGGVADE